MAQFTPINIVRKLKTDAASDMASSIVGDERKALDDQHHKRPTSKCRTLAKKCCKSAAASILTSLSRAVAFMTPSTKSRKTGFLDLPGEIRNEVYRLACPGFWCDIEALSNKDPFAMRRPRHPLARIHPRITREWNSFEFQDTILSLRYRPLNPDKTIQVWDTWIQDESLIKSTLASIERLDFILVDQSSFSSELRVDIEIHIREVPGSQRRLIFFASEIQWAKDPSDDVKFEHNLHAKLWRRFAEIATGCEGPFGKDELTRIRDVAFDALQEVYLKAKSVN